VLDCNSARPPSNSTASFERRLPREAGSANLAIPMSDRLTASREYTCRPQARVAGAVVRAYFAKKIADAMISAKRVSEGRWTFPCAGAEP
jgi:hypothetical protein